MSLPEIQERINRACVRSGRQPSEVQLIAVSKNHSLEQIQQHVLRYGSFPLGENRVQEWREKNAARPEIEWHFIGNLQRNKVKYCQNIHLFHSVNSERLADEINKRAEQWGKHVGVLLEINVAAEASKEGVTLAEAEALKTHMQGLAHLHLRGLMTMAPYDANPENARPYFRRLRELRDAWGLQELSMGMSGDFEVAIEEGATMVRIGSALFR